MTPATHFNATTATPNVLLHSTGKSLGDGRRVLRPACAAGARVKEPHGPRQGRRRSSEGSKRGLLFPLMRVVVVGVAILVWLAALPALAIAQTLSVFPDNSAQTKAVSSSGSVNFGLVGLQTGQGYYREIRCDPPVINCGSPTQEPFTSSTTSITVNYQTAATGGVGRIVLKVYRAGFTPTDTGSYNITVDGTPPSVQLILPTSSVSGDLPTIQLGWCDNGSLSSATRWITVNGLDRTSSFNYAGASLSGCASSATSTTSSVPLLMGSNSITGHICDSFSQCTTTSFTIVRAARGIAVRAEWSQRQHFAGTSGSQRFFVKNLEAGMTSFTLSAACGGVATGCAVIPATLANLRPGQSGTATVTYNVAAGSPGTVILKANDASFVDSATVAVTGINSPAPVVSVVDANPGTILGRSLCVTISSGSGTAFECGDLRVVHPLPAIKTVNKSRAPTLLYSSAHADPYPIVAASVTLSPTATIPDSVEGVLTVNGLEKTRGRWAGSDWTAGATRRIALGYSASGDTTKVYDYSLEVATISGSTRTPTTVTGKLIIVNRRGGGFGAGWWLAGLERLEMMADGSKLWVGGDGSARLYTSVGSTQWVSSSVDGPDTLKFDGTLYTRSVTGGVKVRFNSAGQHVATINRLGHQTSFAYNGALLSMITLPSQGGSQVYGFGYDANGQLSTVSSPGARTTTVSITSGRVDAITDPDAQVVRFTYEDVSSKRIASRMDRRGTVTSFAYDAGKKLARAKVDLQPDSIRLGFIAQETRGLLGASPKTATDTAAVYTDFFGPRTFATRVNDRVNQETRLYVDRFGAPKRIRDALGDTAVVTRADGEWAAAATQLIDATGFTTRAGYDARGNMIRAIAVNPFGDGRDTVTRYHYDPRWDAVDSVVTPMGVVTTAAYDSTYGNRLWQQVGSDTRRRVTFNYGNSLGLLSSTVQQGIVLDSVLYDSQGNLAATRTASDYWTSYYKDALGRDTVVVSPIDSSDHSHGGVGDSTTRRRDRVQYTVMDRGWFTEAIAPNRTESIQVTKSFDAEGNLLSLARAPYPHIINQIGTITTSWRYDRANRHVAEIAPDLAVDSTDYDPAGNVVSAVTRRTDPTTGARVTIAMAYDALNRLTTRTLPAVNYAARPTHFTITTPWPVLNYPALTLPGDTQTFTYDSVGRMLRADNSDAKVKRSYYANGMLKTDSLWIQTVGRDDWSKHIYGLRRNYDFDGRLTRLDVPKQLGLTADTSVAYGYDAQTGAVQTLTALQASGYTFGYDFLGQLASVSYPGGYSQVRHYDADGRLSSDTIRNDGAAVYPRMPTALARATTLRYDARNKLIFSGDGVRFRDTLVTSYSGLGNLKRSLWLQYGCDRCDLPLDNTHAVREGHTQDALGNHMLDSVSDQGQTPNGGFYGSGTHYDTSAYEVNTGRLLTVSPAYGPRRTYSYDAAGNEEFNWAMDPAKTSTERASFYAADGTLRMIDSRLAANSQAVRGETQQYTVEDYRYDALGRRVWVRARRKCDDWAMGRFQAIQCRTGLVRRTVWDGDQELAEIQMPWSLQGGLGGYDSTSYATLADNDTGVVNLPHIGTSDAYGGDPDPFFGHVIYAGRQGVDQPLAVTRVHYGYAMDWNYPSNVFSPPRHQAAFTIVPFWNVTGEAQQGVTSTGNLTLCSPSSGYTECAGIQWPWDESSSDREGTMTRGAWQGTLLESKRDKSGLGYMRNRYYDPATARFTQEDPAGIAGGLNAYGFAAGDPINFADPFGLCPQAAGGDGKTDVYADCPEGTSGYYAWKAAQGKGGFVNNVKGAVASCNESTGCKALAGVGAAIVGGWVIEGAVALGGGAAAEGAVVAGEAATAGEATAAVSEMASAKEVFDFAKIAEWGSGRAATASRLESITAEEARAMDPRMVQRVKAFYEDAIARGTGAGTAPLRVKLMQKILDLQK